MDVSKILDCNSVEEQEIVSRYVGQKLSPEEAEAFEEHYFGCDRCWAEVQGATEVRAALMEEKVAAVSAPSARARVIRGPWRNLALLAAAAGVALLVTFVVAVRRRGSDSDSALPVISAALSDTRQIEPRLGGLEWKRFVGVMRGSAENTDPNRETLESAEAYAQNKVRERPSAENWRLLGITQLLRHRRKEALESLSLARSLEPENPRIWSDFAAFFLARGDFNDQKGDYALALEAAEKAIGIGTRRKGDPPLEAYFNRALALQRLEIRDQAIKAWRDYRRRDPRSHWAEEALAYLHEPNGSSSSLQRWQEERQRLDADIARRTLPTRRIVTDFPQPVREWVERELLPRWGDAVVSGKPLDANNALLFAEMLSGDLALITGDRLVPDTIGLIKKAYRLGDKAILSDLAQAHRDYRDGRLMLDNLHLSPARNSLEAADLAFRRSHSPFAGWTAFHLAICSYYDGKASRIMPALESIAALASERNYIVLLGRVRWVQGLINRVVGDLAQSTAHYTTALQCFQKTGEIENAAAVESLLAENLDYLRNPDLGWKQRGVAFEHLGGVFDPQRRHTIFVSAALASLRQDLPRAALHFQNEALAATIDSRDPVARAEGHLYRAVIEARLGDTAGAAKDLAAAKQWIGEIKEESIVDRVKAELLEQEGELWRDHSPAEAVESFSDAITRFERLKLTSRLPPLYLGRAKALIATGRYKAAEDDLALGIAGLEERRDPLLDRSLRLSFFEQSAELFSQMIGLQATWRQRSDRALEFAERARARDLLDALAGSVPHEVGAGTPLTPEAIRHRLGPDSALVYYFVLPDRVLTWVITSRSVQSMQQVMRASEIESLAGILRASVHSPGSSSFRTGSERLYEVLIRPIKPHLQLGETLVFIPAGALQALPFAALRDRRSRQFLVEQHPVAIAPSGSIFVRSTERLRNSSSGHPSLLVFGNPKLRGEAGLPSRLRAAEAEAIQIASLYGDADLRSGATATKGLFLTLAGRHEVVHFAGHAIADTEIPFASRLLLASDDPKDSGVLRADEIANRRFPKTRLAVLAACSTGVGIADRLEGSLSLAWSFLAAGVPSVVISLWDVEDRPSQHLFVNLHRALTAGKDFPVALQEAQLLLLHSGDASLDSPASWGGFEVIGGIGTINERRGENHETSN